MPNYSAELLRETQFKKQRLLVHHGTIGGRDYPLTWCCLYRKNLHFTKGGRKQANYITKGIFLLIALLYLLKNAVTVIK